MATLIWLYFPISTTKLIYNNPNPLANHRIKEGHNYPRYIIAKGNRIEGIEAKW